MQKQKLDCGDIMKEKKKENKKRVSYFYRAAQLSTLAAFPPWGSSRGAGRKRLTPAQI